MKYGEVKIEVYAGDIFIYCMDEQVEWFCGEVFKSIFPLWLARSAILIAWDRPGKNRKEVEIIWKSGLYCLVRIQGYDTRQAVKFKLFDALNIIPKPGTYVWVEVRA